MVALECADVDLVLLNSRQTGYGLFNPDERSLKFLVERLHTLEGAIVVDSAL